MSIAKISINEKLFGQSDSILGKAKAFELADIRQIQSSNGRCSFLNHEIVGVTFQSNKKHMITSITFPLSMNLNHTLYDQLIEIYGEPDGMFKKGEHSKTTISEDSRKTKITEHQMVQVSFDERPEFIVRNKNTFQLRIRPCAKEGVTSFFYKGNN